MASTTRKSQIDILLDALEPEQLSEDEVMSLILLNGLPTETKNNQPAIGYLVGSSEDSARLKLATLLRSVLPLNRKIRLALADLFDPNPSDAVISLERMFNGYPEKIGSIERKLVFKARRPGPRSKDDLHERIARFVNERVESGDKKTAAVQLACEEFEVKRTTVNNACRTWKSVLKLEAAQSARQS